MAGSAWHGLGYRSSRLNFFDRSGGRLGPTCIQARLSPLFRGHTLDFPQTPPGRARAVPEAIERRWQQLLQKKALPCDNPDGIPQESRVRWEVDVRLHNGGIRSELCRILQAQAHCSPDDGLVEETGRFRGEAVERTSEGVVLRDGAGEEAGIKEGDVVVKIDQTPIHSSTALIEYVGRHRPGDKLMITVNRKGKEITYPVVLKTREGEVTTIKPEERKGYASLGFELEDIDAKELKSLELENGVKVKSLGNGKLARYTDIREGFIITKVNDVPVKSVNEFNEILKNKKAGDLIILTGTYEDFPREFNYAFRM